MSTLGTDPESGADSQPLDYIAWQGAWDNLAARCRLEIGSRRLALIDGISYLEDLARTLGGPIEAEGGLQRACLKAARQLRVVLPNDFREGIIDRNIATHGALAPNVEVALDRVRIMRSVFFALREPRGYRYVPVDGLEHIRRALSAATVPRELPPPVDPVPTPDQRVAVVIWFALAYASATGIAVAAASALILFFSSLSSPPPEDTIARVLTTSYFVAFGGLTGIVLFHAWLFRHREVLRSVQKHDLSPLGDLCGIMLALSSLYDAGRTTS